MSPLTSEQAQLVADHVYLADQVVLRHSYLLPFANRDDLTGACLEAMCRLAKKWEPEKGLFKNFAWVRLCGAIKDELRKFDHCPHDIRCDLNRIQGAEWRLFSELGRPPTDSEIAAKAGVSVDRYTKVVNSAEVGSLVIDRLSGNGEWYWDLTTPDQLTVAVAMERRAQLKTAIESLDPRKRHIISGWLEGRTLLSLGADYDHTEAWASLQLKDAREMVTAALTGSMPRGVVPRAKCTWCGDEFETSLKTIKYCSDECRRIGTTTGRNRPRRQRRREMRAECAAAQGGEG